MFKCKQLPSWWTLRPPDFKFLFTRPRAIAETTEIWGQTLYASHIFYGPWPSHKERASWNYFNTHRRYDSLLRPLEELEQFTEVQFEHPYVYVEATGRNGSGISVFFSASLLDVREPMNLISPQDLSSVGKHLFTVHVEETLDPFSLLFTIMLCLHWWEQELMAYPLLGCLYWVAMWPAKAAFNKWKYRLFLPLLPPTLVRSHMTHLV